MLFVILNFAIFVPIESGSVILKKCILKLQWSFSIRTVFMAVCGKGAVSYMDSDFIQQEIITNMRKTSGIPVEIFIECFSRMTLWGMIINGTHLGEQQKDIFLLLGH